MRRRLLVIVYNYVLNCLTKDTTNLEICHGTLTLVLGAMEGDAQELKSSCIFEDVVIRG